MDNNVQLLSRLLQDCRYYLGYGFGYNKALWAGNVADQIAKMRELYDMLDVKPKWICPEVIDEYEYLMQQAEQMAEQSIKPIDKAGRVVIPPQYLPDGYYVDEK